MKQAIQNIINDAGHGDHLALIGLLDYLFIEKNCTMEYILFLAFKHFRIPPSVVLLTIRRLTWH